MDQRHCCETVRIVLIVRNRAVLTCERVSAHTIAHVVRNDPDCWIPTRWQQSTNKHHSRAGRSSFDASGQFWSSFFLRMRAAKKIQDLIMLCGDLIDGFDVATIAPCSKLYGLKFGRYKSLFKPFKALLPMEIKQHAPGFQINTKNKTVLQSKEEL